MKGLLSTSEAAKHLGITRQGVAYLIGRGLMKAERVGRFLVIREDEVRRLAAQTRKPGPKKADEK